MRQGSDYAEKVSFLPNSSVLATNMPTINRPVKPRRRPVTSKRVVKDSDDELEIMCVQVVEHTANSAQLTSLKYSSDEKEAPTTT